MARYLEKFKCYACKTLPDEDFVCNCSNDHFYCLSCAQETNRICRCSCDLVEKENPLNEVNLHCQFRRNGCTWKFSGNNLENHLKECQFRQYQCVGKILKVKDWQCSWSGLQHKFRDHFEQSHQNISSVFNFREIGTFPFPRIINDAEKFNQICLIDAFNKTFVLYYEVSSELRSINIIIYLLGRKQSAKKYFYEFEIQDQNRNQTNKIKFSQNIYTDSDDIQELIKTGKCISLSLRVIKNFVYDNKFNYRFIMIKKETISPDK